jgi:hypothetical protein
VKGGLFARLLAAMCGVAAASTVLVLAFQERSLSGDLERAAQSRLERAATATERLIENHLETVAERYRAASRATGSWPGRATTPSTPSRWR